MMSLISISIFYFNPYVLALLNSQTMYISPYFYLWSHVEQEMNIWLSIYYGSGSELDTYSSLWTPQEVHNDIVLDWQGT